MAYPEPSDADIEFFRAHGWLRLEHAIDPDDLVELIARCDEIVERRDELAFDWAWQAGTPRDAREFRIVQASPTRLWPAIGDARFRRWAGEFATALMGRSMEFWYDQFLAKPPYNDAPTHWHQDEAYWGRRLVDAGITCWMPFHDVDPRNGCMHFIDRGHRDGVLAHRLADDVQSDLLVCRPDEARTVACPLASGGVTFHHARTPHMTPANETDGWRRILAQHFKSPHVSGEGDHYPWKVYVNQFTGETHVPKRR